MQKIRIQQSDIDDSLLFTIFNGERSTEFYQGSFRDGWKHDISMSSNDERLMFEYIGKLNED